MKYAVTPVGQKAYEVCIGHAEKASLTHLKSAINGEWKPKNKAEAEMIDKALCWGFTKLAEVLKAVLAQKWPSWDGTKQRRFTEYQAKAVIIGWCYTLEDEISQTEHVNYLIDSIESGTPAYIQFAAMAYTVFYKEQRID